MRPVHAAPGEVPQQVREVHLEEGTSTVHTLEVTGAPNLKTRIHLNDTFLARNVLCGVSCSVGITGEAAKPAAPVNWMMEVRAEERSLVVWPARLPGPQRSPEHFTTNLQVMADGGHLINITLRLVRVTPDGTAWAPADAVVALILPESATAAYRDSAQSRATQAALMSAVEAEWSARLARALTGPVYCQFTRGPSLRRDHTRVSITQMCTSTGEPGLAWALVHIENRGAESLALEQITLEPVGPSESLDLAVQHVILPPDIRPDGSADVAVVRQRSSTEARLGAWRVRVTPAASRKPINLEPLTFPSH